MRRIRTVSIIVLALWLVNVPVAYSQEKEIRRTVENQMKIYPHSTLCDLYKHFFQDHFGPGHLIADTASAGEYLRKELAITPTSNGLLYEQTGHQGRYVRVNLSLVKDGIIPYSTFFHAFLRSAEDFRSVSIDAWEKEWLAINAIIASMELDLENYEQDSITIRQLLKEGKYVMHHSDNYVNAYNPHYRIISRDIFQQELLPLIALHENNDDKDRMHSHTISEAIVTGTRNITDIRHLPQTVTIVRREKLTENQRISILPTLMEQVPGLMVTNRGMLGYGVSTGGSGGMMLRGISSGAGQVMVLIDGHPQYNGIYGHSIADAYQTMMAERVEVLRGPASLLYGSNAMGGVVNIVTRGMRTDGSRTYVNLGSGSWGTVQGEAGYRLRQGKWRMTASGQYSRTDNHRPNMGFEQYGGFAKIQYDIDSHWNIFADADITHFNASYPGTVSVPMREADQWITRGAMAVGITNNYGKTSGRLSMYDNFGRHKINDGYNALSGSPQTRLFRSNDALMGISFYQSAMIWKGSRLTTGFDYQNIYGHAYYTSRETGEILETQNKQSGKERNHELAGYADLRQDIFPWLTAETGVRYDHHTVTGDEWIPQAGIVVRPTDNSEFKLMASKGFRNPTMREMYLYPPSNTDLKPERMWSYELSWKQRLLHGKLQYGINLFYIDADNIIQTVNRQNVNTGEIKNKGIEADLQYHINSHWSVNTNHSWLDMRHPVVSAPKYKGYLGMSTNHGRWGISAGLMQVCGLYTSTGTDKATEYFTLVNATISYTICPAIRLWVKGENLLSQRYEYIAGMPMPKATFMGGVNIEL